MNWLNLLLMAVISLGNFAIVVAVVNRVHVIRIHLRTLSIIRRSHVLFIIGFTVALVWQGGFGRRDCYLTAAGSTSHRFINCTSSPVESRRRSRRVIVVRRWFFKPTAALLKQTAEVVDVAKVLGNQPVAAGRYHRLATLPGNEVFQVEISTKEFQLAGLPERWDGLSILHVSDLHFIGTITRDYFAEVLRRGQELGSDIVVFTGDLLDNQRLTDWLPETLGQLHAPLGCYFILGNHDWELDPNATRRCLRDLGWIDVGGRCTTVEHTQRKLLIAGSEYPWMGKNPDIAAAATLISGCC